MYRNQRFDMRQVISGQFRVIVDKRIVAEKLRPIVVFSYHHAPSLRCAVVFAQAVTPQSLKPEYTYQRVYRVQLHVEVCDIPPFSFDDKDSAFLFATDYLHAAC